MDNETIEEKEEMVPKEKWLRSVADIDNLRKNMNSKINLAIKNERKEIFSYIIEVLDSFKCAIEIQKEVDDFGNGIRNIYLQMHNILKKYEIEQILAEGKRFDHNLHEAISLVNVSKDQDGIIIEELQHGYIFKDGSLLRPSRVIVGTKGEIE